MAKKETTTIRITKELKEDLEEIKGNNLSHEKFIRHLLEVFLGKK